MKNRRNKTRRTLRQLTATFNEDEIDDLCNTLFESYKQEYPEDQYCDNNPFNTLDMGSDEESSQERDTITPLTKMMAAETLVR
jgi:hypothetical protein